MGSRTEAQLGGDEVMAKVAELTVRERIKVAAIALSGPRHSRGEICTSPNGGNPKEINAYQYLQERGNR